MAVEDIYKIDKQLYLKSLFYYFSLPYDLPALTASTGLVLGLSASHKQAYLQQLQEAMLRLDRSNQFLFRAVVKSLLLGNSALSEHLETTRFPHRQMSTAKLALENLERLTRLFLCGPTDDQEMIKSVTENSQSGCRIC